MEGNDIQSHSLHHDSRVTDDSKLGNELSKFQLVQDRKFYVRRVSSKVANLRKASRPLTSINVNVEPHSGLFEMFLEVTLFHEIQLDLHTPYIKSSYPHSVTIPFGVEKFCFPDSTHWPTPLPTAGESYTIILTDANGERLYGYCRRVVPEGAQTCTPIVYCFLSRHQFPGLYKKLLNVMVSCHGASVSQLALLECLHKQPFPNPGRFIKLPGRRKVDGVQRLLDGRLEDIDLRVLFERLNETVVQNVLGTVLLERKLIFVSQNISLLSLCIDAVQSILYPFVWQHTIVHVLPQSMTKMASASTPFILGLSSKNGEDWKSIYPDQGVLVDLDSGKVLHSVGDESTILPPLTARKLLSDWEMINDKQHVETARNALYSESFLRMFVDLCGHYEQNIHCSDSGQKYFEVEDFSRNHSNSSVRDFLQWFTETAMFTLFIESRLRHDAVQTLFENKIADDEAEVAEEAHQAEAEIYQGGNQVKDNVETSGQENTGVRGENEGGSSVQEDVSAEVESEDKGQAAGPSKSKHLQKRCSERLTKEASSSDEEEAEHGGYGENSKEGPDEEEEGDVSTSKPKSGQAKRNVRKKKMKRQAPEKQEVESDDELRKRFKEYCNSSDEGAKKHKYSKNK